MNRIEELVGILQSFKKGGKIHIKKENRGKFTDYCGGKVTSECIARGKSSPNPAIRKRATFAANARKWKHQQGGSMIYKTMLTPAEEELFNKWYQQYAMTHGLDKDPDNPEHYYDYRGYWKEGPEYNSLIFNEHLPDKWKTPGHPTFSDESIYNNTAYIPTIEDLANFTGGFETFRADPYTLKTSDGKDQVLAGYGSANPEIIRLAREGKLTEDIAKKELIRRLQADYDEWGRVLPEFNNLPEEVKLALVDTSYNGRGVRGTISRSPNLIRLLRSGVTDGTQIASYLTHSKSSNGWLGVRSAARRAMAQGKYNWSWDNLDKYGRQVDYNQYKGPSDWKASPYYKKYQQGGLFYTPFIAKSLSDVKEDNNEVVSWMPDNDSFPVEPVKAYSFAPIIWSNELKEKQRGKTAFKNDNIDVGNMQELLEKFEEAGISVRVTSGKENRKTASGKTSKHAVADAIDIIPIEGQTYADLKEQIKSSPELLAYMRNNGIGIIDETNPIIKQKTGATGDHWHISRNENFALLGFKNLFG